ncbi:hypothetical protein Tco_0617267 [Tanacetum coccineum]
MVIMFIRKKMLRSTYQAFGCLFLTVIKAFVCLRKCFGLTKICCNGGGASYNLRMHTGDVGGDDVEWKEVVEVVSEFRGWDVRYCRSVLNKQLRILRIALSYWVREGVVEKMAVLAYWSYWDSVVGWWVEGLVVGKGTEEGAFRGE